jgi:hypothetical protein
MIRPQSRSTIFRQGLLDQVYGCKRIDFKQAAHLIDFNIDRLLSRRIWNASIVDQNIDPPKRCLGSLDNLGGVFFVTEIGCCERCSVCRAADAPCFFKRCLIGRGQKDAMPGL